MKALVVFFGLILFGATAFAQYDYNDDYGSSSNGPDRYFYNEDFDWRWDVRVRISDGIDNGMLTRNEANRLYNKLERIERKEYAFQSDGYLSAYEQDEIWDDVVDLNRLIGIELRDWDRTYYGYSARGLNYSGYSPWYFGSTYDFYRFDTRGYGSISFGYRPRAFYPRSSVYYRNRSYTSNWNNRSSNWNRSNNWDRERTWNNNRSRSEDRNNSRYNGRSSDRGTSSNRNNSGSLGSGYDRNSNPSNGAQRNGSRLESSTPSQRNSRGNESSNAVPQRNDNRIESPSSPSQRNSRGNDSYNSIPQRSDSRIETPSSPSQRGGGRTEAPSSTSRGRESSSREAIQTPRSSSRGSEGSSRSSNSSPERGSSNNARRGGNNF